MMKQKDIKDITKYSQSGEELKLEKRVGCQARKFTIASIRFTPSTSCDPDRCHRKPLIFF